MVRLQRRVCEITTVKRRRRGRGRLLQVQRTVQVARTVVFAQHLHRFHLTCSRDEGILAKRPIFRVRKYFGLPDPELFVRIPRSFYQQAKKLGKPLISTVL
jgi:hypothetical protein